MVKMSVFLKRGYKFNVIPIKIPAGFVAEMDMLILKFIWKFKGPRIVKLFFFLLIIRNKERTKLEYSHFPTS